MVKYECVIHQKVNYVLDHLNFRKYSQKVRMIPKLNNSFKNKHLNNVKNR